MEFAPDLLLNGVLALLIIKEVLQFVNTLVRSRNTSSETEKITGIIKSVDQQSQKVLSEINKRSAVIAEKMDDMYKWHNEKDEDGVFLWYVRKSLARSVDELSKALLSQNEALRQLLQDNKDLLREENLLKQVVQDNQKLIQNNQRVVQDNQVLIKDNRDFIKNLGSFKTDLERAATLAAKERTELERKIFDKMDACFNKLKNKE